MMNGYNKDEALAYIVPRIDPKGHKELAKQIPALISQAIDADMAFMHATRVIDQDGNAGDNYSDDDEAFEYIVDAIAEANHMNDAQAAKVGALVDDYMDVQQAFLEEKGLVDWE